MASPSTMCMACLRSGRAGMLRNSCTRANPLRQGANRSFSLTHPATTRSPLYLDFLAPSIHSRLSISFASPRTPQFGSLKPLHHSFSSASVTRKAIQNPRKDEEGNEMSIEITPRAANRLHQIMTADSNPDLALRITVESGGCHGFQYLMSLTDSSKISPDEDTVFEGAHGTKVVLDEPSLDLLKGSKVDYTMELIGSQFKIVDNPLATSSCGCGTSFDIKM
ncbi:hypothetical protein AOQ84DRAFT_336838 [Glonium stellatum]|uniref:Core domain-containing protein n=1 Tax=Glonium stellatum TaxID=574774 RepID=A0A8E2F5A4_9PEZI|nr:hypothetical protein AOQ84DRAFT_336838 [Glonium stellatum]